MSLSGVAVCLALLSLAGQWSKYRLGHDSVFGLVRLLDVDEEASLPTWFSSSLLLVASLLLALIAANARRTRDPHARHWCGLAVVFAFLSADEAAGFHEMLTKPLRSELDTGGFLYYAWVIPYGIAVLVLATLYLRFLLALPARTRLLFLVASGTYLAGAIGLELIGGEMVSLWGRDYLAWGVETAVEELLEMLGVIVFIHGLLGHLAPGAERAVVAIEAPEPRAPLLHRVISGRRHAS